MRERRPEIGPVANMIRSVAASPEREECEPARPHQTLAPPAHVHADNWDRRRVGAARPSGLSAAIAQLQQSGLKTLDVLGIAALQRLSGVVLPAVDVHDRDDLPARALRLRLVNQLQRLLLLHGIDESALLIELDETDGVERVPAFNRRP